MGSLDSLPSASSPTLILTHPTPSERRRTWSLTHANWGPALSHSDYLAREEYITTIPGSTNGRLQSWILTDSSLPPDERPVLSSCDTLRKSAVVSSPNNNAETSAVKEGVAFGIGSVFTAPEFRGQGYASRMMRELGSALRAWRLDAGSRPHESSGGVPVNGNGAAKGDDDAAPLFSVLYSDIGKGFYAKHGWPPYESTHVSWTPVSGSPSALSASAESSTPDSSSATLSSSVQPLTKNDLPSLCATDESVLLDSLPHIASATSRPAVALLPDTDTMLWHLHREDFMCSHVFPDKRTPSVRGAITASLPVGQRVWAVWSRGYYGGLAKPGDNTLHILRVVVEGDDGNGLSEAQVEGFRGIVELARREAGEWLCSEVQLWNPCGNVKELVERCGGGSLVVREEESIASLMWYGGGDGDDGGNGKEVEWVANDKFGWC